jgi:hypothetical protein
MHRNNKHRSSLRNNNVIMLRIQKSKQKTCSCCASNFYILLLPLFVSTSATDLFFSPFLDIFITIRRFSFTLTCDRTVEMNGKMYALEQMELSNFIWRGKFSWYISRRTNQFNESSVPRNNTVMVHRLFRTL